MHIWNNIRKSILALSVVSAVITLAALVNTGRFETPAGLAICIIEIGYLAVFAMANAN